MKILCIVKIIPLPFDRFYADLAYNALRRTKLLLMNEFLTEYQQYQNLSDLQKLDLIDALEKAAANRATQHANELNIRINWNGKGFTDIYHTFCSSLLSLFDKKDEIGNSLLDRLLSGDLQPDDLIRCRIADLCQEQYKDIISNVVIRQNVEMIEKHSSFYFCPKCKNNQCTIERMYSRSLDEGQNVKIHCTFCKYAWIG